MKRSKPGIKSIAAKMFGLTKQESAGQPVQISLNLSIPNIIERNKTFAMYEPISINPEESAAVSGPAVDCYKKWALWNKTEHYYIKLACKSWKCPHCARVKKIQLYKRLKLGKVKNWPIKTHVILTVQDQESDENIDRLFNNLITYLRRGEFVRVINNKPVVIHKNKALNTDRLIKRPNIKYVWVKEFQFERFLHQGLWFRHIHVIFDQAISKYDIIPIWNHVTGVDFNYVEHRSVKAWDNGNYLLKYLAKAVFQNQFLDRERRYGCSKGVLQPINKNQEKKEEWVFLKLELARELHLQYKLNPERFDQNFDKILELIKLKEYFIRASATDNFTVLNL